MGNPDQASGIPVKRKNFMQLTKNRAIADEHYSDEIQ
jgi:hypothetical protein